MPVPVPLPVQCKPVALAVAVPVVKGERASFAVDVRSPLTSLFFRMNIIQILCYRRVDHANTLM